MSTAGQGQPLYFRSGAAELFGWLHPADCAAAGGEPPAGGRLGLVICNPFGYEAICAHRSLRRWAEAAAARGVPALRFDYAGTGDSGDAGAGPDAEQLAVWTRDIGAAIDTLRARCGVERVCLLGVRLGALAAALAGAARAVEALIAIVPVSEPRRYLRELRTLQSPAADATAGLEVNGFALSAATLRRLGELDPAAIGPPAARVLIIERSDLPGAGRWAASLAQRGVAVTSQALPGFVEMVSTPHASAVPARMLATSLRWLLGARAAAPLSPGRRGADGVGAAAEPVTPPAPVTMPAAMRLSAADEPPRASAPLFAGVCEQAQWLDAQQRLFGILSTPYESSPTHDPRPPAAQAALGRRARRGVILLNAGATHHVGPNRLYVMLARRWAALGDVVLRLDLAGLGDSAARPGGPAGEVYPQSAVEDVRAAIEFLRDRCGVAAVTLLGLCSGAFHSLRAALAGLPVERILMINPLTFFWREGMRLSDPQEAQILRSPSVYRQRVRSRQSWRKLLTGRVDLRPIARTLAQRALLALDAQRRDLARGLHIRLHDDLGSQLEALAARGVQMAFFFAQADPGVALLRLQAGRSLQRLGGRCRIHLIDGADHIFSQRGPRERLIGALERAASASVPMREVAEYRVAAVERQQYQQRIGQQRAHRLAGR